MSREDQETDREKLLNSVNRFFRSLRRQKAGSKPLAYQQSQSGASPI